MYIPMERHRGPLPDVDPDLWGTTALTWDSARSRFLSMDAFSTSEDVVDPASLALPRHRT